VPAERRRRRPPAGNPRMIPKKRTGLALHLLCDPPCAWEGRRGERIRVWCYMLCFSADVSNARARDVRVAHLKLLIAKMKRDRFGASAERGRKLLDQLEMQLEKLETAAAEGLEAAPQAMPNRTTVRLFTRAKPVRAPLPAHLPRQRVVLPSPTSCPCCGGKLVKLGETITETLETIPRSYKFSCRSCETITQPPAPFHPASQRGVHHAASPAARAERCQTQH
jgi:hypothetical protein